MDRPQQSSASSANSNRPRRRFNKRSAGNFGNTTALLKVAVRNWKSLESMEQKISQLYATGAYGLNFAFDQDLWKATVQLERDAIQAAEDWKQSLTVQQDQGDLEEQPNNESGSKQAIAEVEPSTSPTSTLVSANSCKKPPPTLSGSPQISVRTLYIVPPKETARRGNRLGLAYFVWTIEPPTNEHKDRSTLYRALEALQTSSTLFGNNDGESIQIQEAVNGKAWKEPTSFPNEVGTVFQTDHYKQFLQSSQDRLEQRLSRPKPSPGGGTLPLLNSAAGLVAPNGADEPVAALVQYLQQKHEEEKKRKALRRKERKKKDETPPSSTNGSSAPKPVSAKVEVNGNSAAGIKKRSRRQRKKKNGKP